MILFSFSTIRQHAMNSHLSIINRRCSPGEQTCPRNGRSFTENSFSRFQDKKKRDSLLKAAISGQQNGGQEPPVNVGLSKGDAERIIWHRNSFRRVDPLPPTPLFVWNERYS
ncbi:hypothetical protein CDAR_410951 [Caerostris darwini]|uniref:Uncharacterized protein n=1 Tax=Caerostris darwini TaxID=1538125 RepID=A0AAV4SIF0_9ARAC|nr:hypothetical protein CDAR_410951 [Caerostris darwini]